MRTWLGHHRQMGWNNFKNVQYFWVSGLLPHSDDSPYIFLRKRNTKFKTNNKTATKNDISCHWKGTLTLISSAFLKVQPIWFLRHCRFILVSLSCSGWQRNILRREPVLPSLCFGRSLQDGRVQVIPCEIVALTLQKMAWIWLCPGLQQ